MEEMTNLIQKCCGKIMQEGRFKDLYHCGSCGKSWSLVSGTIKTMINGESNEVAMIRAQHERWHDKNLQADFRSLLQQKFEMLEYIDWLEKKLANQEEQTRGEEE